METEEVEQLVEREEVPNSPFAIIKADDKYFLTMGKYRLSEPSPDKKEILKLTKINWNTLLQVIGVMIEEYKPKTPKQNG